MDSRTFLREFINIDPRWNRGIRWLRFIKNLREIRGKFESNALIIERFNSSSNELFLELEEINLIRYVLVFNLGIKLDRIEINFLRFFKRIWEKCLAIVSLKPSITSAIQVKSSRLLCSSFNRQTRILALFSSNRSTCFILANDVNFRAMWFERIASTLARLKIGN